MFAPLGLALATLAPAVIAVTWDVSVGAGKLAFEPESVNAAAGDIVQFVFHPKNHTVTQSTFEAPCTPLAGGIDTGFMPVDSETSALPSYQYTVKDTNVVWIHCRQPSPPKSHCSQGMVFAINPPAEGSEKSFSNFKAKAIAGAAAPAAGSSAAPAANTATEPPAPHWASATATVTGASSTWTTTYTSYDGTPPPTPAAQPEDHKIIVGDGGQLKYSPANITAKIGDTVTFEFRPKNHTVTQSSFLKPCVPLSESSGGQQVGFKSGFMPVAADASAPFPTFQIKINDTAPIWGYCGQTGHCAAGMVFSINAVEGGPNNYGAFQSVAGKAASAASTSPAASARPTTGGAARSLPGASMLLIGIASSLVIFFL